jgi:hypothetical protein
MADPHAPLQFVRVAELAAVALPAFIIVLALLGRTRGIIERVPALVTVPALIQQPRGDSSTIGSWLDSVPSIELRVILREPGRSASWKRSSQTKPYSLDQKAPGIAEAPRIQLFAERPKLSDGGHPSSLAALRRVTARRLISQYPVPPSFASRSVALRQGMIHGLDRQSIPRVALSALSSRECAMRPSTGECPRTLRVYP